MSGRLQDRVAIVTGAGCVGPGWGNGRATAVRFADDGALVDLLMQIAPTPGELKALLVDNPQRFDRFGKIGPAKQARP